MRGADLNAITLEFRALHPRLVYEMARTRRFGRFSLAEVHTFELGLQTREAGRLRPQLLAKADWFASGWWRGHQSPNRIEDDFELSIIFALEVFKLVSQLNITRQHSPEVYKRAHDFNIDLDCTVAV